MHQDDLGSGRRFRRRWATSRTPIASHPRGRRMDGWVRGRSKEGGSSPACPSHGVGQREAGHNGFRVIDEVESQGLTPDGFAEKAKQVTARTLEAGKQAAKEEELEPETMRAKSSAVGQQGKDEVTSGKSDPGSGRDA